MGKEKEVLEIKIDVRDAVIRDLRASQARLNHKLASQAHSAGTDLAYEKWFHDCEGMSSGIPSM